MYYYTINGEASIVVSHEEDYEGYEFDDIIESIIDEIIDEVLDPEYKNLYSQNKIKLRRSTFVLFKAFQEKLKSAGFNIVAYHNGWTLDLKQIDRY